MNKKTKGPKGVNDREAFVIGISLIIIGLFFVIGSGTIGLIIMLCGLGLMTPKTYAGWREIKRQRKWRK